MSVSAVPSHLPAWRPRERLLAFSAQSLSDTELWICILGQSRRGLPVHRLAHNVVTMLAQYQKHAQARSTLSTGPAQTARILAVHELIRRQQHEAALPVATLATALTLCHDLRTAPVEHMRVLYCNSRGQVLHQQTVALGGLNIAVVQPRDIFFPIRLQPIDSLLVCHNHPGGNPEPSPEDIAFTQQLVTASSILGLRIRDHVIVTRQQHFSFRQAGLLKQNKSLANARPGDESIRFTHVL